jgi:2-polyprenyl-3-methyl-5-hydroxy-6-metoxy-1,4-benzoquinol methylase
MPDADSSRGYEACSASFMSIRDKSNIGVATVRAWAEAMPRRSAVLDLGCGHGVPISQTLLDAGLVVYGIDASPSLVDSFRARFPDVPVECNSVETSKLFGRQFDGAIAWGLMFLLAPDVQEIILHKVAAALRPAGRFLFTAPRQACEWLDILTGRPSISLGRETYRKILAAAGLLLGDEQEDEGQNHYFFAQKPARAAEE